MDKLDNMSLAELTEKLEQVEKDIEREKELLGEAKNAHFQDGDELWLTYKLQFRPIDKIEDKKTKKLLFNKKQIEQVRLGLEKITALRNRKNEILLEKVKRELNNELYKGIVDFGENKKGYLSYNFKIEDIKEYGNSLPDDQKYKYYARLETELNRIINAFQYSEFMRFDGNMYFGLVDFIDSVEYIIEKENCPELEVIVREKIKNLDIYAGEKEFKRTIKMIEFDLIILPERLAKTRELIGYEIEYLEKLMGKKVDVDRITIKEETKNRKKIKISNEIIAEEVTKHWDDGLEEFEDIYEKLSECSEEVFGVKLTKGQIKGRYQRYSKKHKDFRREKYK